jgi:hypothetical protein
MADLPMPRTIPLASVAKTVPFSSLEAHRIERSPGVGVRAAVLVCVLIVVLAMALAASGSPKKHVIEQARAGDLTAELSYLDSPQTHSYVYRRKTTRYTTHRYTDLRLSLLRSGQLVFSRLLNCTGCSPAGSLAPHPQRSVRFEPLQAGGGPVVLLDLYTGGAHCCFSSDLLLPGRSDVRMIQETWGDPGYRLEDLGNDRALELVTADDGFAYAFTDFADSSFPIKILKLEHASLVNVTRSYPKQVEADAATLWASYLKKRTSQNRDVRGVLAAWAADEALLGRWPQAFAALDVALARGDLDQGAAEASWPLGRSYLSSLRQFLTKNGNL